MHGLLDQHPQISMCRTKEPRFFQQPNCLEQLSTYELLFDGLADAVYYGEASPNYSETSVFPCTVENLYTYNPSARIIYIVREPLARLASVWVQAQSTGHWSKAGDYGRPMPLKYSRAIVEYPPLLEATRYWSHLSAYLERFPRDQIRVLFFEDLVTKPESVMQDLFGFLNLPNTFTLNTAAIERNSREGKAMYNPLTARLSSIVPARLASFVPGSVTSSIGAILNRFSGREIVLPVLETAMEDWIRKELAWEVQKIYEYTDTRTDPWNFQGYLLEQ